MLGYLYQNGEGTETDYAKAAENYQAAVEQDTRLQPTISLFSTATGWACRTIPPKPWSYINLRAQTGDSIAQCNLGMMYYHGEGVPRDYTLAVKWFRDAAEQGNAQAQHNLGFLYFKGLGVPSDYKESAHREGLAAEQGEPFAQTDLAYLYESGRGVPLDYVAAYARYSGAIAGGDKAAAQRRNSLSRIMTRRQLDAAHALVVAESSEPQRRPKRPTTVVMALFEARR